MRHDRLRPGLTKLAVTLAAGGLLTALVSLQAAPGTASTSAPSATGAAGYWAPLQVGASHLTQAQAIAAAQRFHIFAAPAPVLAPYVGVMRNANPTVILLAYVNGTYQPSGSAFPQSLYLHDARGKPVRSQAYGNYLMDFTNPAWVANRVTACTSAINSAHLDGCHLDVLGTGSLGSGYVTGVPINPHTHKVFTPADWLHGTDALAAKVQSAAGANRTIIGNGLGDGTRFFNVGPSSILLGGESGGVAEGWIRNANDSLTAWPSVAVWQQNVDMLGTGSQGKIIVTITKTWGKGSAALVAQWHQFSEASFLLGNSGKDAYSFFASRTSDALTADPWSGFPIGMPTGAYRATGNGFERDFTTGKVIVNPSSGPMTVSLGGSYRALTGGRMTSATLPAHTGLILTSQ